MHIEFLHGHLHFRVYQLAVAVEHNGCAQSVSSSAGALPFTGKQDMELAHGIAGHADSGCPRLGEGFRCKQVQALQHCILLCGNGIMDIFLSACFQCKRPLLHTGAGKDLAVRLAVQRKGRDGLPPVRGIVCQELDHIYGSRGGGFLADGHRCVLDGGGQAGNPEGIGPFLQRFRLGDHTVLSLPYLRLNGDGGHYGFGFGINIIIHIRPVHLRHRHIISPVNIRQVAQLCAGLGLQGPGVGCAGLQGVLDAVRRFHSYFIIRHTGQSGAGVFHPDHNTQAGAVFGLLVQDTLQLHVQKIIQLNGRSCSSGKHRQCAVRRVHGKSGAQERDGYSHRCQR
ncbi:hypothetical protein D3C75_656700 [compost metagenome]